MFRGSREQVDRICGSVGNSYTAVRATRSPIPNSLIKLDRRQMAR